MSKKYKIIAILILLFLFGISWNGCGCPWIQSSCRDFKSGITGLTRTVTLYSVDGTIIGEWTGSNMYVDTTDGICSFIDDTRMRVILSGTFVIQEFK